ncbi:MAG: LLM class flavin-dependent oxidoreductase [Alphaproteobacteria bacterium]|nr:LLM class flavin-dependent oxidoreductase [Alphaproteobacteria bacterium]
MTDLTFGWFLPTSGDSTCLGDPASRIPQSLEMFDEVVAAVDNGGYKYLLMPVNATCWEATVVASYYVARTKNVAPLVALRSAYCNPSLSAKMFATLDQMSGGRLCINLIAGISDDDTLADGILDSKQVRYEKMEEEVSIMKRLWTSDTPIGFEGKHYNVNQVIEPKPLQQPHPPFFLGGGSEQALDISAKHSTVHLFWGDRPAEIAVKIKDMRKRAAAYGREGALNFGMRLQIICAESEGEAWEEAQRLIAGATRFNLINNRDGLNAIEGIRRTSEANQRVWQLLDESGDDMKIHPHLWTGISTVRAGAGIAVVGTPKQIADTLDEFVEAGCTSFCLSGYPHAKAARLFTDKVMPLFKGRLADTLPTAA